VVVLSNNDSAVVSRSDEAKALGVKMSQPRHELEYLVRRQGLILRSSNYTLYADINRRFMSALATQVPETAPYSIDESFFLLSGMKGDLQEIGAAIQRHILTKVGIPVGIGISRNRTTAKLCNWASKKWKRQTGSVVTVMDYERLRRLLAVADVSEVWGIGRRLTDHLGNYGIKTALQLADADAQHMRRMHGIGLARTIRELNWEYCIGPDDDASPRQSMACTRTFPQPISSYIDLASYMASFAARLGKKLRREHQMADSVRIFIQPSRSSLMTLQGKSATIALVVPSSDSRDLIEAAMTGLKACFEEGGEWIRAGFMVMQTVPVANYTPDLFAPDSRPRSSELMHALDRINRISGDGTIRFGSEHRNMGKLLRRQYPSNRFTTSWIELPEAR
jgi:DNA polymerase V